MDVVDSKWVKPGSSFGEWKAGERERNTFHKSIFNQHFSEALQKSKSGKIAREDEKNLIEQWKA